MKFRLIGSILFVILLVVVYVLQTNGQSQDSPVQSQPVTNNDAFSNLKIN